MFEEGGVCLDFRIPKQKCKCYVVFFFNEVFRCICDVFHMLCSRYLYLTQCHGLWWCGFRRHAMTSCKIYTDAANHIFLKRMYKFNVVHLALYSGSEVC